MQSFPFSAFFEAAGADYPRPQGPQLRLEQLLPGDVLLSRGAGDLADSIVASDGGSYSHAALWTGDGVLEARLDGVHERPLHDGRDVYRYRGDHRPLSSSQAAAVVARARSKLGGHYATHEILLLGTLFALGLFPRQSLLHSALQALGGAHAERLEELIAGLAPGQRRLICTELVALAFYEADATHCLALRVLPIAERPVARPLSPSVAQLHSTTSTGLVPRENSPEFTVRGASELMPEADVVLLDELRRHCARLCATPSLSRAAISTNIDTGSATDGATRGVLWGSLAIATSSGERLGVITPADMQFSPSLCFEGHVVAQVA